MKNRQTANVSKFTNHEEFMERQYKLLQDKDDFVPLDEKVKQKPKQT